MAQVRQLAAIMFADIVGYTALMEEDEALALNLRHKLQKKLEHEVSSHYGRILDFRGDGALCTFSSSIEGIKAALALQIEMQLPPVVPLRIGIHVGDVVAEGNTIYGDGVNIASRLESLAIPGSIFFSGKVYDDIKNQKDLQTLLLGKYSLKNVKEPMDVYALSNSGIITPETHYLEGKGQKVQSKCILVLPFVNLSNDPEQEYFSDGLTEELISSLARLRGMKIISRTTSMQYKGTKKDIRSIGREIGAGYIMEGSVRIQGNHLKITAQFVDADNDVYLWAESYKGNMEDIFDIQEKVSLKIVDALRIQLTGEEKHALHKRYTDDADAYQFYLQGRYHWNKRNEPGLNMALHFFEKSIKKDESYALAWAGLADTYSLMGEYTNISRRALLSKQMAAVNRALQLDSQLPEAHISLAISLMLNEWDWKNSEKEFKLGIKLNPNYATGRHWYAEWLLYNGKFDEALHEISTAVELDPFSQGILKDKGIHFYYTRQYDKAIEIALKTLDLDPGFVPVHRLLSLAYQGKGLHDQAIKENQIWGSKTGNLIKTDISLAHLYAVAGRRQEVKNIIDRIEAHQLGSNDYRGMALVYTAMEDKEKALEWLEKSYEKHEESLCSLNVDPKFDLLHSEKRFDDLLKKLGLKK